MLVQFYRGWSIPVMFAEVFEQRTEGDRKVNHVASRHKQLQRSEKYMSEESEE